MVKICIVCPSHMIDGAADNQKFKEEFHRCYTSEVSRITTLYVKKGVFFKAFGPTGICVKSHKLPHVIIIYSSRHLWCYSAALADSLNCCDAGPESVKSEEWADLKALDPNHNIFFCCYQTQISQTNKQKLILIPRLLWTTMKNVFL